MVTVKYEDLSTALEFVSSGMPTEHRAYISIDTSGGTFRAGAPKILIRNLGFDARNARATRDHSRILVRAQKDARPGPRRDPAALRLGKGSKVVAASSTTAGRAVREEVPNPGAAA